MNGPDQRRQLTKHSLAYILDLPPREPAPSLACDELAVLTRRDSVSNLLKALTNSLGHEPHARQAGRRVKRFEIELSSAQKRLARQCSVDGCANYTIDRGLCFRHGGGKTCSLEDCTRSAKARGLCWRHGGSIRCSVAGCHRGAKSRALCWSHGGGRRCAVGGCDALVSRRRGVLCDAHESVAIPN